MNHYRAVSVVGGATFGEDVFEAEFSPAEEADWLNGGHLAIVPRAYEQLSDNFSAASQGQTFEAAYAVEHEAALISGGHIQRVEQHKPRAVRGSKKTKES